MKYRVFLFLLLLVLSIFLGACGGEANKHVSIQMEAMQFVKPAVQVKAGEAVTLEIVNRDGYAHTFDMDDFDIHVPLKANESVQVVFNPTNAGIYAFYCGSPGHKNAGMVGTLTVTP